MLLRHCDATCANMRAANCNLRTCRLSSTTNLYPFSTGCYGKTVTSSPVTDFLVLIAKSRDPICSIFLAHMLRWGIRTLTRHIFPPTGSQVAYRRCDNLEGGEEGLHFLWRQASLLVVIPTLSSFIYGSGVEPSPLLLRPFIGLLY
jgi:hypothetical protein